MQAAELKPSTPFEEMLVRIISRSLPGSPEAQAIRANALTQVILAEMNRLGLCVTGIDSKA